MPKKKIVKAAKKNEVKIADKRAPSSAVAPSVAPVPEVLQQPPAPVDAEVPAEPDSLQAPDMFLLMKGEVAYRSPEVSKALEYVPNQPFQVSEHIEKTPAGVWLDFGLLGLGVFFFLFAFWIWFIWRV